MLKPMVSDKIEQLDEWPNKSVSHCLKNIKRSPNDLKSGKSPITGGEDPLWWQDDSEYNISMVAQGQNTAVANVPNCCLL